MIVFGWLYVFVYLIQNTTLLDIRIVYGDVILPLALVLLYQLQYFPVEGVVLGILAHTLAGLVDERLDLVVLLDGLEEVRLPVRIFLFHQYHTPVVLVHKHSKYQHANHPEESSHQKQLHHELVSDDLALRPPQEALGGHRCERKYLMEFGGSVCHDLSERLQRYPLANCLKCCYEHIYP